MNWKKKSGCDFLNEVLNMFKYLTLKYSNNPPCLTKITYANDKSLMDAGFYFEVLKKDANEAVFLIVKEEMNLSNLQVSEIIKKFKEVARNIVVQGVFSIFQKRFFH